MFVRWTVLGLLAVLFTTVQIQYSYDRGRLAWPPYADDIGYFVDGIHRLDDVYAQGWSSLPLEYMKGAPHSPFSSLLAMLGFLVFGIRDWVPYAMNSVIVLAFFWATAYFTKGMRLWQRIGVMAFVVTLPMAAAMIDEFRPDLAYALAAAIAVVLPLRRSLVKSDAKYRLACGTWFAAALMAKPAIFLLTISTIALSWLLSLVCDWIDRPKEFSLKRAIGAWSVAGLPVLYALAIPHFILNWRHLIDYMLVSMASPQAKLWTLPGGRIVQLEYYLNGLSGMFMFGAAHAILVVLLLGLALAYFVVWERSNKDKLLRAISLGLVTIFAYAVPAFTPNKNPFFAGEFHILLVLETILALRMFSISQSRFASRLGAALVFAVASVSLWQWSFPDPWAGGGGGEQAREAQRVLDSIVDVVSDNADQHAHVLLTGFGWINAPGVEYRLRQRGRIASVDDRHRDDDLSVYSAAFAEADVVIAAEPGVFEYQADLPSSHIFAETLKLVRSDPKFHEIASVPSASGKLFFVFGRVSNFGGWKGIDHLWGVEQAGDGPVRWGLYPQVGIRFSAARATKYRLMTEGHSLIAGQVMTISLDGHEIARHAYSSADLFEPASVEFDVSAGDHEITLLFSRMQPPGPGDSRPLAVLFRRLVLTPANDASASGPQRPN